MIGPLQAISVGSAVPRNGFEGTVHSVFHRAANLRLPGDIPLVTLLASEKSDLPQGIRLGDTGGPAFEQLSVGAHAVCRDSILVVSDSLTVDLRASSTWECDLPSIAVDMTNAAVEIAWMHAWHALRERQVRSEPETIAANSTDRIPAHQSVLSQYLEQAKCAILRATTIYDTGGISQVSALVGAGIGLTPSGDDFLTGYLAGLWCTIKDSPERRALLSLVAQLVVEHSVRTNDIARTYLLLAARGQVSCGLVELARAISRCADHRSVVSCAQAAMRLGYSSGVDTVTGLLLGLAAWDRPDLALPG